MGDQLAYTFIISIGSILASSGFWMWMMKKLSGKDAANRMLMGLGHDRIIYLGLHFIDRGFVSTDEYENLYEFLYTPYREMGGNGSACRIMDEVKKLPLKKGPINENFEQQMGKSGSSKIY